jgi:hypothetical protein
MDARVTMTTDQLINVLVLFAIALILAIQFRLLIGIGLRG